MSTIEPGLAVRTPPAGTIKYLRMVEFQHCNLALNLKRDLVHTYLPSSEATAVKSGLVDMQTRQLMSNMMPIHCTNSMRRLTGVK